MSSTHTVKKSNWLLLLWILLAFIVFVAFMRIAGPLLDKAHREETLRRVYFLEIARSVKAYVESGPSAMPVRLQDFAAAGVLSTQEMAFAEHNGMKYFPPASTSPRQQVIILTMPFGDDVEYRYRLDGTYENVKTNN